MIFWQSYPRYMRQHPSWGTWYGRAQRQPGWVIKLTITAAVLTVVIPLVLLMLAAIVVAAGVFVVGSLIAGGINLISSLFGGIFSTSRGGGRRNARVIQRP